MKLTINGVLIEDVSIAEALELLGQNRPKQTRTYTRKTVGKTVPRRGPKKHSRVLWSKEEIIRLVQLTNTATVWEAKHDTMLRTRHTKTAIATQYASIKRGDFDKMSAENAQIAKNEARKWQSDEVVASEN